MHTLKSLCQNCRKMWWIHKYFLFFSFSLLFLFFFSFSLFSFSSFEPQFLYFSDKNKTISGYYFAKLVLSHGNILNSSLNRLERLPEDLASVSQKKKKKRITIIIINTKKKKKKKMKVSHWILRLSCIRKITTGFGRPWNCFENYIFW